MEKLSSSIYNFFMKVRYFFLSVLFCIILFSCSSTKKVPFVELNSLKELNGTYSNNQNLLADALGLEQNDINLITIDFENNKTLNISYHTDTGTVKLKYKGKFKGNYFETYLRKRRLFTIIFNSYITDKINIGKNKNNHLFIKRIQWGFGGFLMYWEVGNKYISTYCSEDEKTEEVSPFLYNGRWGYKNNFTDSIIIAPKYDYATFFEDNIARVKFNGKWQLIDKKGDALTDLKYDKIESFGSNISTIIHINNKKGILNKRGIEVVPVTYDDIGYLYKSLIVRSKRNNKYGYVSPYGEVYPPIFDYAERFFPDQSDPAQEVYVLVKIGKFFYLIDNKGNAYKYKYKVLGIYQPPKITDDSRINIYDLVNTSDYRE